MEYLEKGLSLLIARDFPAEVDVVPIGDAIGMNVADMIAGVMVYGSQSKGSFRPVTRVVRTPKNAYVKQIFRVDAVSVEDEVISGVIDWRKPAVVFRGIYVKHQSDLLQVVMQASVTRMA